MKKYISITLLLLIPFKVIPEQKTINYHTNFHEVKTDPWRDIILSIQQVESKGSKTLYNKKERAAGILQIRPIMIREVNRIVGYKKYKLKDRWDSTKSVQIFKTYQKNFNPTADLEVASRIWNGGIRGMRKRSTLKYYKKVKQIYDEIRNEQQNPS